jgi:hypothetical protein
MPGPYATSEQLAGYWHALSDADAARATVLLGAAGDLIDERPGSADFVPTALKWVSLDMVKRAMIASANGEGVNSVQQGMADMTANVAFANPMGNLYITPRELARLIGQQPPTGSIKQTNHAHAPRQIWNSQYGQWGDQGPWCGEDGGSDACP